MRVPEMEYMSNQSAPTETKSEVAWKSYLAPSGEIAEIHHEMRGIIGDIILLAFAYAPASDRGVSRRARNCRAKISLL